jgi:hypothetical protein
VILLNVRNEESLGSSDGDEKLFSFVEREEWDRAQKLCKYFNPDSARMDIVVGN